MVALQVAINHVHGQRIHRALICSPGTPRSTSASLSAGRFQIIYCRRSKSGVCVHLLEELGGVGDEVPAEAADVAAICP